MKMSADTKSALEILIHQILRIVNEVNYPVSSTQAGAAFDKIKRLLRSWVRANDLHPERVISLKAGETMQRYGLRFEVDDVGNLIIKEVDKNES